MTLHVFQDEVKNLKLIRFIASFMKSIFLNQRLENLIQHFK